ALGDEGPELRLRVLLVDDLIPDIRTIEARHKTRRTDKAEAIDDLLSRRLVRRRRKRNPRHVGKTLCYQGQADIFGAEVVAPLRDAMRLVDRKQRDGG